MLYGSPRAGGFRLRVPDSQSEEDFRIDVDWIVASAQPARQRLLEVTRPVLASLQRAVCETTQTNWPAAARATRCPSPTPRSAAMT